jgi:phosphocarrier protein HPr
MMILQATKGTVLNIRADGEDEASALQQIVALINDLFEEAE